MRLADKITLGRLCLLPLMWVFALLGWIYGLVVLLVIDRIGDGLDGYVARKTGGGTKLGKKLDGVADGLVYISVAIWFFLFFPKVYLENLGWVAVLGVMIGLPFLISLVKFRRLVFFHLISSKVLAGVFLILFLSLLFDRLVRWVFLVFVLMVVFNSVERGVILLLRKKIPEDLRSVFELR